MKIGSLAILLASTTAAWTQAQYFPDLHWEEKEPAAFGIDSMALNGYLVPGDVDVFKVVPAANEAVPFLGVAILAAALPPACNELIDATEAAHYLKGHPDPALP